MLVGMHGGEIEAHSAGLGHGSEFEVRLPRYVGPVERDSRHQRHEREGEPSRARPSEPREPLRVLVVDDEEDAADSLVEILRARGHDARAAYDGEATMVEARGFRPQVVLLDLGLPGLDGYEVARRLRSELGPPPPMLVALTGYQREEQRLVDAGFDDHVIKPPDLDRLMRLLGSAEAHA